jgi:cytochrome P450
MSPAATELAENRDSAGSPNTLRPPFPPPRERPLGLFQLLCALQKNPLETWTQAHFEQSVVIERAAFARVAIVSEPAAIRRVLPDNAGNYQKDWLQRRILSSGLGGGLLTAEADQWRVQRRTLAPMFARRIVRAFAPAMKRAADELAARWRDRNGELVDLAAEMTRLTLDVLQCTIFSDGLGRDTDDFRAAMAIYFDTIGRIDPLDLLGVPAFVPRFGRRKTRPALAFFDGAIDDIIAARRRRLADSPRSIPRDILTLLLEAQDPETGEGLSEAEVRANILTYIAAGHETTANALTWTLYLLSRSPAWRARVEAEIEREIAGPIATLADRLVVTRAAIEEAMRLYPPIVAISRVALGPDRLGPEIVRRGMMIVIAPYVVHRHRRLWDDPDVFDPGRFLPPARERIDRFAYLPFGAGPRICIGSSFALQEASIVLATIMRHCRLAVAPGHAVRPFHRVTLRPGGGLPVTVRLRQDETSDRKVVAMRPTGPS